LAFNGCNEVATIEFEDGETEIQINQTAFDSVSPTVVYFGRQMDFTKIGCSEMEIVEFGKYVTSISNDTFKDGSKIRDVSVYNTTPPTAEDIFSSKTYLEGVLYVPETAIDTYSSTIGWKNFWEIKPLPNYDALKAIFIDNGTTFSIDGNTLHLIGDSLVRIVSINGSTIYNGNGNRDINLAKGMYIVAIGDKASKIIVK
jgi:hypothetical protein